MLAALAALFEVGPFSIFDTVRDRSGLQMLINLFVEVCIYILFWWLLLIIETYLDLIADEH